MVEDGFLQPDPVFFSGEFYGADIEVDAILSYPWMRENGIGFSLIVRPWLNTTLVLGYYMPGEKIKHPKYFWGEAQERQGGEADFSNAPCREYPSEIWP